MEILQRENYCLSCEHVLEEKGWVFEDKKPYVATPISTEKKYCERCKQLIEPNIEEVSSDCNKFISALKNPKIKVVAYVAPSVRSGIGECFSVEGDCQHKIVSALKKLGCYSVFSMNFGADLTIMEESKEFEERLSSGNNLPLLTSCCPAWVNYIYKIYPAIKPNLSTCKSPQQMMGSIINTYYAKIKGFDNTDLFVVSIVPCVSKKIERLRFGINSSKGFDVDSCITTVELARIIKDNNIDFSNLEDTPFDELFEHYSGSAAAFGAAGGVSEAILRNIDPNFEIIEQTESTIVEKKVLLNGKTIYIAQIEGLINTKELIESILKNNCKYHLVEVMSCSGGCIGGAGQPFNKEGLPTRRKILQSSKEKAKIKQAKDNPIIKQLYKTFLTNQTAQNLLHEKRD